MAIAIARPSAVIKKLKNFDEIVWQSVETGTVAETLKKLYTDPTLVKSPTQLLSKVKNTLSPDLAGKIDSWQFWLSNEWPSLSDEMAEGLIDEKMGRLATKRYELKKENLARQIKLSQESGNIEEIKKLVKNLSELTKEK